MRRGHSLVHSDEEVDYSLVPSPTLVKKARRSPLRFCRRSIEYLVYLIGAVPLSTWILLIITIIAQLFTGLIYIFGVVSQVLVDSGFSPTQIDTLYACGTLGQYFGIFPGFLHDLKGPIVALTYGIFGTLVGYALICYLLATQLCLLTPDIQSLSIFAAIDAKISHIAFNQTSPPYCPAPPTDPPRSSTIAAIGFALFLLSQGGAALHYSIFPTLLSQFTAKRRGLISGIVAGSYGLSGLILTWLYDSHFKAPDVDSRPWLISFFAILGCTILLLTSILGLLLTLVKHEAVEEEVNNEEPSTPYKTTLALQVAQDSPPAMASTFAMEVKIGNAVQQFRPFGALQRAFFSFRYLGYLILQSFLQATCAVLIGNVALIRSAYVPDDTSRFPTVSHLVRIISIGNFLGRICSGLVSQAISPYNVKAFFVVAGALTLTSQAILISNDSLNSSVLSLALFGIAWAMGTNFAQGPVWLMQVFSPKIFASLQAMVMASIALCTFGLAIYTGESYETEARRQMMNKMAAGNLINDGAPLKCQGAVCFEGPLALGLTTSSVALLIAVLLKPR